MMKVAAEKAKGKEPGGPERMKMAGTISAAAENPISVILLSIPISKQSMTEKHPKRTMPKTKMAGIKKKVWSN